MSRRQPREIGAVEHPTAEIDIPTVVLVMTPVRTIDQIAAEVAPMVFRLLGVGQYEAAAALIMTYAEETERALWADIMAEPDDVIRSDASVLEA